MKTGAELIADERKRQIEVLGWSANHDLRYEDGQLLDAAYNFLIGRAQHAWTSRKRGDTPDKIRELTKAGAMIAAELDRLNKLAGKL